MTFKKLALAAAVALVPTAGFSMEVLDDSALSSVTGQDGVEINIASSGIGADIVIHDKDGFVGAASDGAIVMDGFLLTPGAGGININIDAGDQTVAGAAGSATLNINVTIPTGTQIVTGAVQVGNSGRDDTPANWNAANAQTVMDSMTIKLGTTALNIQLGNELQDVAGTSAATTEMIAISTQIGNGGIAITGFGLYDNDPAASGKIGTAGVTRIINTGADDATGVLDVGIGINATAAGLVMEIGQLGTTGSGGGIDVRIADMFLGSAGAGTVGDVSINALQLSGTVVTISGK